MNEQSVPKQIHQTPVLILLSKSLISNLNIFFEIIYISISMHVNSSYVVALVMIR